MNNNLAYQEKLWGERLDGKIIATSPRPTINRHRIAFKIAYHFEKYLEGCKCIPFAGSMDLHFTEKNIFIPVRPAQNQRKWSLRHSGPGSGSTAPQHGQTGQRL